MKIEAKLLASAEDTRIKKIRAPNFFIFSTNTEKTLFGAEPPGGLLNMKKNLTTRAFTNSDLADIYSGFCADKCCASCRQIVR